MRGRALGMVGLLVMVATAGCVASSVDEALDGAAATQAALPERTPLAFEGTIVSGMRSERHVIAVPSDTLFIELTVTSDGATSGSARGTLYAPDGARVVEVPNGATVAVPHVPLAHAGFGDYELEVWGGLTTAQVPYQVEGVLATGAVPDAVVAPPVAATGVANDGVVVAVIDTGVNVYHKAFRTATPTQAAPVDALTGELARSVPVTLNDDRDAAVMADDAVWRGLERGVLYRFEGTPFLGISMIADDVRTDQYPVLDEHGHGTGTSWSVLHVAPTATVVLVEVSATSWAEVARAIEWTAAQPWIDVVSVSMGNIGNVENPIVAGGDPDALVPQATRKVVESGKIYVNSAGNDPTVSVTDHPDGPPWVVSVSGAEERAKGRDVLASNVQDFVGNFTINGPTPFGVDGYAWMHGTSFSTPLVAGAFARAIHALRSATGHEGGLTASGALVDAGGLTLVNHDVRAAFNRTASYWDATAYDPTAFPDDDPGTIALATSAPVLPVPYVQMGWGFVGDAEADAAVAHLLGTEVAPEKGADAVAFMAAYDDARQAFWNERLG